MDAAITHNELLEKFPLGSFYKNSELNGMLRSIRAVIKRHYPFEFHLGDVISEIQCAECKKKYPCNTITDIEKELS